MSAPQPQRGGGDRSIRTFEIANLVLAILAGIATHLLAGTGQMLTGVLIGAVISVLNIRGMVWLGQRIQTAPKHSRRTYVVLFAGKLVVVMTAVLLALLTLPVNPLGLVLGFSTIIPASFVLLAARSLAPDTTPEKGSQRL